MNIISRIKKRLKIGPDRRDLIEFAEQTPNSLSQEIATRAATWDFFALNLYLPNPDPVLRKQGRSQIVYRDLLIDSRVGAAVQSRKAGVLKMNWQINQGDSPGPIFELIQETFGRLDIHKIVSSILDAPFYGYSPQEIIWDPKTWTPKDVVGKPPEWFVFGQDNRLRFKARSASVQGIELDPLQFICPVYNPTYLNPYGEPLAAKVFWPATFKKGSWRFWITFTEKYGMPWVIGKHPRGADQTVINAMADQLESMVQDAVAVIPEDAKVEIQQSGTTANAEIYERLIAQSNQEISTAILGHAGAGESTPGKLGNENGAMEVRGDLIDSDRRLVEATMNRLIQITLDVNGIKATAPTFRLYEDEDIDITLATRDEKLVPVLSASGKKFSKGYLVKSYGLAEDDLEDTVPTPPPGSGANFSEGDTLEDILTRAIMARELRDRMGHHIGG